MKIIKIYFFPAKQKSSGSKRLTLPPCCQNSLIYKAFQLGKIKKSGSNLYHCYRTFVVPVAGVEPARVISPTDFESVTSANSITPANYVLSDTARTIMLVYIIPHCG